MPPRRRDGTPTAAPNKRKLNDLMVKRLAPADRPYLVWDSHQRGLAVRVETTGRKSYKVIYPHHGRPRWYSIGAADAIGLQDARKLAGRIMFAVAEGKDPQADRKAERGAGTFTELATQYVEQHAKKNNKSWVQADKLVRKHLLPRWGKLPAANISRSDVNAMMGRIEAPIVANQTLAAVSAIFTWAIRKEIGGIKINPCLGVDRNKTKSRERILSDHELPKFWAAFDQAGLLQSTALKMILLLGQRPGEVSHMRFEQITDGWWTLPGWPCEGWPGTKNGETHMVWLSAPVVSLLREVTDDGNLTGPVFPRLGQLDKAMRAICIQLGINNKATPHDLRRTFSSKVTALKFGRDAMNRVTNHKEGGIADVYDRHQYAEENKQIMETVAAHLMALVVP
jgi:integrase